MGTNTSGELYDKLGAGYDEAVTPIEKLVRPMRAEMMPLAKGEVLEVAIASGKNFEFYPKNVHVLGVDPSEEQLKIAHRRAEAHGISFDLRVGDAAHLEFENGRFDTAVCVLGGCVFADPVACYAELRRVLKPTGRVIFIEHVWPEEWYLRAALTLAKPIAKWKIGCDPTRDVLGFMREAGLRPEPPRQTAAQGIARALIATPA